MQEICSKLESGQNDIVTFLSDSSAEVFFKGSDERWSPAHHLAHLTFTHKRVTRGFKAKDRLQDYAEEPKSYEEVKSTYLTALQKAASAGFLRNNPFAAKVESDNKETEIAAFLQAAQALREAVSDWSEIDLNTKGMEHPLLALLSAREILLFMIYHDQHHLLNIQKLVKD
jgi:DinB superfamily